LSAILGRIASATLNIDISQIEFTVDRGHPVGKILMTFDISIDGGIIAR
jgi:hypothetical protein